MYKGLVNRDPFSRATLLDRSKGLLPGLIRSWKSPHRLPLSLSHTCTSDGPVEAASGKLDDGPNKNNRMNLSASRDQGYS